MNKPKNRNSLTAETARYLFSYDQESGALTWRVTKGRAKAGRVANTKSRSGYLTVCVDGHTYLVHRIIWLHHTGAWPEHEMDHRNGVRDDNRIANLREATRLENLQNRVKSSLNTSGYQGVYWIRKLKKWQAQLSIGGHAVSLGFFSQIDDAVNARKEAKRKFHSFQPESRA